MVEKQIILKLFKYDGTQNFIAMELQEFRMIGRNTCFHSFSGTAGIRDWTYLDQNLVISNEIILIRLHPMYYNCEARCIV